MFKKIWNKWLRFNNVITNDELAKKLEVESYVPQYEPTSNSTTIVITTEKQPTKKELATLKKKVAAVKPKVARKTPVRKRKETPSSSD